MISKDQKQNKSITRKRFTNGLIEHWMKLKMASSRLILPIACVLLVCVRQTTEAGLGCRNMNLNKLCRKHGALQIEVDEIWGIIISSGIQKQDYGNKTRMDDLGVNAQELIANVDGSLTTIQGLKTEVEHLIVSSRNGLKHEKKWKREAIRNVTKVCDNFQTEVKKENDHLKQIIHDMQKNNQQELNNIETENKELRSIIVEVRKDYLNINQILREMQNDNLKMKTELTKLQATTTISTTTPLPTTTTKTTTKSLPFLCDGDWEHFNGHCYLVVKRTISWDDASAYCTSKKVAIC